MPSARHSAESRCYSSKMHMELEQRLVEHGDGWCDILSRLCEDLGPANDAIRQSIEAAEQESFHTREVASGREPCGKAIGLSPGAMSTREHTEPAYEHQGRSAFEPE
jgi:hypothetical protein